MSTPRPLFSVITANFNSGRKLEATYDSVVMQGGAWEYILIDGQSTDGSLEIFKKLTANDTRVVLIHGPDCGIYDAMNKGVAAATGRYIYFLGAGDTLMPGAFDQVAAYLPNHDSAFVYGDVLWGGGKRYDGPFNWRKLVNHNICHQCIFHGRDIFQACGLFDLKYSRGADWEYNLRVFGNRKICKKYVPMVVADFEIGGISSAGDEAIERDRWALIRKHLGLSRYLQSCSEDWLYRARSHITRRIAKLSNGAK